VPTLLHLDSSADTRTSASRAITATFAQAWRERGPDHTVVYRDLCADQIPHLTNAALHWAPSLRAVALPGAPEPDAADGARQDALLAELTAADVLLVGAPMYNWSMPSALKAWIDQIHVMAVTAPFGNEARPMAGRPAVIVTSSGDGGYGPGGANEGKNHAVPPLELVLGASLGMTVTVIETDFTLAPLLDGLAEQRPHAQAAREAAHARARELATALG
jgi:FMN-dependent NADH-azoreductase